MAPFLQMRHLQGAGPFTLAIALLLLLLQALPIEAAGNGKDFARTANDFNLGCSGCTIDLGKKDLAPVFTSCR